MADELNWGDATRQSELVRSMAFLKSMGLEQCKGKAVTEKKEQKTKSVATSDVVSWGVGKTDNKVAGTAL